MKINAKTLANLFKAIGKTSFATKKEENVEELNSVKMVAVNGKLQIISVNSKISVACMIPKFDGTFNITADNTTLPSCIEAATDQDGNVEFDHDEENRLMLIGCANVPVPTAAEKKSKFTCVDSEACVSVLATDLIKAINGVIISVSKDNELMKNVRFTFDAANVSFKMTAFNGNMMAITQIPLEDMDGDYVIPQILVNGEVLKSIVPLLSLEGCKIIDISLKDGKMMLSSDNIKIVIGYCTEEFVKCDKLLEANFTEHVTFNTKELKKEINAIYKAVKSNIAFYSDGIHATFRSGNFMMPAKIINASNVHFELPITLLKNIVANIVGETITLSVANEVLIMAHSEDMADITYVTGGVKH